MSVNGYPHYTEYMNLSINELSKKFKKHMLKELCYKYDNTQSNSTYNTLNKLKKVDLVKRLYELLHTENANDQGRIAKIHFIDDKRLEEKSQQKQKRQNKLSEYEEKLDEIESLMKDTDFREMFLNRLQYIIDVEITPSIHTLW